MKRVFLIGAGGHAKVVISTLKAADYEVVAAFDDDEAKWGSELLGVPVLGPISRAKKEGLEAAVLGIGDNRIRKTLAESLDLEWISVVHPHSFVDSSVRLGEGVVVFAGALIQPDATIGRHAIVNTGATIDHDCGIGEFAHVAPGAHLAGEVSIGAGALIGIGSSLIQCISVGEWATVGAGSVVIRDVGPGAVVAGVPARRLRGDV